MAPSCRQPPLPHWGVGKGACRWCGQPVLKADGTPNLRALWHPACVTEYKVATRSAWQRRELYRRDKGKCAACGIIHPRKGLWAADHRTPLFSVNRTLPWHQLITFWSLANLQTLCVQPCHADKTRRETFQRHSGSSS